MNAWVGVGTPLSSPIRAIAPLNHGSSSRRPRSRSSSIEDFDSDWKFWTISRVPSTSPSGNVMLLLGRALEKKKITSADHPVVKALVTPGG